MESHPSPDDCLPSNVFSPGCPSRRILDVIAGKWSLLVIHGLAEGPTRTSELRRRIGGISDKMLIQTLRELERYGFIARHAYPEVPPRVEYALTSLGASLSDPIRALDRWVESNATDIDAARRRFEQRQAGS